MTPAGLLAAFCVAMTLLAVGKLAVVGERTPVDVGTTLVVVGITAFVFVWLDLRETWSIGGVGLASLAVGVVTTAVGVALIVDDW